MFVDRRVEAFALRQEGHAYVVRSSILQYQIGQRKHGPPDGGRTPPRADLQTWPS